MSFSVGYLCSWIKCESRRDRKYWSALSLIGNASNYKQKYRKRRDGLDFVIQDPSKGLDTTYLWTVNTRHYAKMSSEYGGKHRQNNYLLETHEECELGSEERMAQLSVRHLKLNRKS